MADLLRVGRLTPGRITARYDGKSWEAHLSADGSVTFTGLQEGDQYGFDTATDFSAVVVESPVTNGHDFELRAEQALGVEGAKDQAADASETIDGDTSGH